MSIFIHHYNPHIQEGKSLPHLRLPQIRQPTLLVLKAIRLLNGFQAHGFLVSSTSSLLQLIPLFKSQTERCLSSPSFSSTCSATKHWKQSTVLPSLPSSILKGVTPQRRLTQPCKCTEALRTSWRVTAYHFRCGHPDLRKTRLKAK